MGTWVTQLTFRSWLSLTIGSTNQNLGFQVCAANATSTEIYFWPDTYFLNNQKLMTFPVEKYSTSSNKTLKKVKVLNSLLENWSINTFYWVKITVLNAIKDSILWKIMNMSHKHKFKIPPKYFKTEHIGGASEMALVCQVFVTQAWRPELEFTATTYSHML